MSAETGWIYALTNTCLGEDLYKIGATTDDPMIRARQLSSASGVPYPFLVAYKRHVASPFQVEAALHREFAQYRINDSREFFHVALYKIIDAFDRYDETIVDSQSQVYTPWAYLFAGFPDDGSPRKLTTDERLQCEELRSELANKRA